MIKINSKKSTDKKSSVCTPNYSENVKPILFNLPDFAKIDPITGGKALLVIDIRETDYQVFSSMDYFEFKHYQVFRGMCFFEKRLYTVQIDNIAWKMRKFGIKKAIIYLKEKEREENVKHSSNFESSYRLFIDDYDEYNLSTFVDWNYLHIVEAKLIEDFEELGKSFCI